MHFGPNLNFCGVEPQNNCRHILDIPYFFILGFLAAIEQLI